jgi:hypothetical protein
MFVGVGPSFPCGRCASKWGSNVDLLLPPGCIAGLFEALLNRRNVMDGVQEHEVVDHGKHDDAFDWNWNVVDITRHSECTHRDQQEHRRYGCVLLSYLGCFSGLQSRKEETPRFLKFD